MNLIYWSLYLCRSFIKFSKTKNQIVYIWPIQANVPAQCPCVSSCSTNIRGTARNFINIKDGGFSTLSEMSTGFQAILLIIYINFFADNFANLPSLQVEPVLTSDVEAALQRTKPSARSSTDKYKQWQQEFESVWSTVWDYFIRWQDHCDGDSVLSSNITYRSSCQEVLCKTGALKNFAKSTGKQLCRVSFYIKLLTPGMQLY